MSITSKPKSEPQDATLPPPKAKPAKEKQAALKAISEYRRAQAWAVARWPLEKRIVHHRTRVHLPRTYLARHGTDVRALYPGTDINQFVHRHYCEQVVRSERDKAASEGKGDARAEKTMGMGMEGCPNYVGAEGILARRHEYLGPDPRVVGYFVDADGDYHVKFYDTFLGDQWMDDRKWRFDVRLDESGDWVDVDE